MPKGKHQPLTVTSQTVLSSVNVKFFLYLYLSLLWTMSSDEYVCFLQHTRFVQECKDAEPDVLFVGDSMIQLIQQHEVREAIYL